MIRRLAAIALCALLLSACNPQEPVPPQQSSWAVVNWGQKSVVAGESFNVQRDGNSGVAFELNRPAPEGEVRVFFDNRSLPSVAVDGVIVTATIPPEHLATPGSYPVVLELAGEAGRVEVGAFVVVPGSSEQ